MVVKFNTILRFEIQGRTKIHCRNTIRSFLSQIGYTAKYTLIFDYRGLQSSIINNYSRSNYNNNNNIQFARYITLTCIQIIVGGLMKESQRAESTKKKVHNNYV